MKQLLSRVRRAEQGAVTVDWVVLSAGVIITFLLAGEPVYTVSKALVNEIASELSNNPVGVPD